MVIVSITHFRPEPEAEKVMAPLLALNPVQNVKKNVECGNITDPNEALSKQGGLKTFTSCGLQKFDGKQFVECLERWKKLVDQAPGAAGTRIMFGWYSNEVLKSIPEESTSWSHRDCPVWK